MLQKKEKELEQKYAKEMGELRKSKVMSDTLIEQLKTTEQGLMKELDQKK